MAERTAFHLFRMEHYTNEADIKAKFSGFTVLVTIPALTPAMFSQLRAWLPQTYILAAEVNAMRVMIPADGSEPPFPYGQEIKRTFPEKSLWKNCCTGKYVTDGNPQSVNYSLSDAVIAWWRERVARLKNVSTGIYSDDSPDNVPGWLLYDWASLGLVDCDGDSWPDKVVDRHGAYVHGITRLTEALRSGHPGPLIANTGTPRTDSNLHGISLEMSGIPAQEAAAAFKAQLAVSRRPRLCIAWTKNQEELDEWRAVQQADPGLREVIVGFESWREEP